MKKLSFILVLTVLLSMLAGCGKTAPAAQVAATTLPVYTFASRILENTCITCTRLVTEHVSCLHDYSLNIDQVRSSESAEVIVISGAGLEDFLGDLLRHQTGTGNARIFKNPGGKGIDGKGRGCHLGSGGRLTAA